MASYPTSIAEFREKNNIPGISYDPEDKRTIFVEDFTNIENEVIAIEETLGETVQGAYTSLADRLDNIGGGGQIIYDAIVATSGGDYTTLEAALGAGAVNIYIRNGTYTENAARIYASNVCISGESREGVILQYPSNRNLTFSGSGTVVRNLTIKPSGGNSGSAGIVVDADYCAFDNVHFLEGSQNTGFGKINGSYCNLTKCVFESVNNSTDTQFRWQNVYSGHSGKMVDCTFIFRSAHAAALMYVQQDNWLMEGCTIVVNSGNTGAGLFLQSLNAITVAGCNFLSYEQTNQVAIQLTVGGCNVTGNTFNGFKKAIDCDSASNVIGQNKIYQEGVSSPIAMSIDGHKNSITSNNITGRSSSLSGSGLTVAGYDDNVITGNVVSGYATGINITSSAADRTLICGNNYYNNTAGLSDGGTTTTISGNVG